MFSVVVCEKTKILHYHNTAVNTISVGDKLFTKKQNFKWKCQRQPEFHIMLLKEENLVISLLYVLCWYLKCISVVY